MNFLFAAADNTPTRIEELGHHFTNVKQSTPLGGWGVWVFGLIGLLLAIAAIIVFARWWNRRTYDNPRRLFRQLCQLHALDRQQQSLLEDLATVGHLSQPSELFLDPAHFEKQLPESLSKHRSALKAIRDQLFTAPGRGVSGKH